MQCIGAAPVANASALCVDGDYVFVGNDTGLHVLDRRLAPEQMVVGMVGAPDLSPPVKGVACRAGRVFVTDTVGLTVLSAAATPGKLGSAPTTNVPPSFTLAIVVDESRVYAGSNPFVEVFDVTTPSAPAHVSNVSFPSTVTQLAHGGSWLAVGMSSLGQDAVLIRSLASDVLTPISAAGPGFPTAMDIVDDVLYVNGAGTAGAGRLYHFDMANPAAPVPLVVLNVTDATTGLSNNFAVVDEYLFSGGPLVYDIDEPAWVYGTQAGCSKGGRALAGADRTLFSAGTNEVDVIQ